MNWKWAKMKIEKGREREHTAGPVTRKHFPAAAIFLPEFFPLTGKLMVYRRFGTGKTRARPQINWF